jgi:hypothetical protein
MRLLALGAALLLTACATTNELEAAKTSWQGAKYDEVVMAWGAPTRSTQLSDGRDAHTWVSESTVSRPGIYPSIGIFGGSGGSGVGAGVSVGGWGGADRVRCERTLVFQGGRVVEQTWSGSEEACARLRHG